MQPASGTPRQHLSAEQVRDLIVGRPPTVVGGCEVIDLVSGEITDISAHLVAHKSSVSRSSGAAIHGTCRLSLAVELPWAQILARPFMTLRRGDLSARFNLGVYELATPVDRADQDPKVFEVEGYDRLARLRWDVGESRSIAAGDGVLAAVAQAISDAQEGGLGVLLDGIDDDPLAESEWVWPPVGTTWRQVVDEPLASIGWEPLWTDWRGRFRSRPWLPLSQRGTEWVYDANEARSIVKPGRAKALDLWDVPNRWRFVRRNPDLAAPTEGDGIVTFLNADVGASSVAARGGKVCTRTQELDAESHAALVEQARRLVADSLAVSATVQVATATNPLHWHDDIILFRAGAEDQRYVVADWTLGMAGGMTQTWRRISPLLDPEVPE